MNDLSMAYIKATAYFYAIMTLPFALAWGFYAAGVNLDPYFESLMQDQPGVVTDLVALGLGVIPGVVLLRRARDENGKIISAVNEGPLCAKSVHSLLLSVVLTGVLGFGLFLLLALVFMPHMATTYDPYWVTRAPGAIMGMEERLDLLRTSAPIMLGGGAAFGALMWGATQANKVVKFGTWAAFVAFVYFNPLMLMVEQAPPPAPTLMESSADSVTDSPTVEEEMKRMDERE